jgi:hypothetical protein
MSEWTNRIIRHEDVDPAALIANSEHFGLDGYEAATAASQTAYRNIHK